MAIGLGIFLIAVGAIMAFALNESVEAVDLVLVGWILMGAGLAAIIVSLIVNAQNRKRTTVTEQRTTAAPPAQAAEPQAPRAPQKDATQQGAATERREEVRDDPRGTA